ncbi:MAG: hypothetical protein HXS52_11815 [Theionarchaea archaeon]|nr:hypothetical protein [Theionarchaea archaeon]
MSPFESSYGSSNIRRDELRFYSKYHFDFIVNILLVSQIESYGAPVKVKRTEIVIFGLGIALFLFFLFESSFISGFLGGIIFLIGLFSEKIIDYEWQGGEFAERLNQDSELADMLRRAKAPHIEIRGNHIYLGDSKLPDQMLFSSIEKIAEHIVEASANWK